MFKLSMPLAKRFACLAGVCTFVSLAAACSQQEVEKFGAVATPVEDVGACAFVNADACPTPDRSPSVAVARVSIAADKTGLRTK